jgi:hypothetical protein
MLQLAAQGEGSQQVQEEQRQEQWQQGPGQLCMGLLASDFGAGLPLRASLFDAAISVSAVQWLLHRPDSQRALASLFRDLLSLLVSYCACK